MTFAHRHLTLLAGAGLVLSLAFYYLIPWSPLAFLAWVAIAFLAYLRLEIGLGFVLLATPFHLVQRPIGPLSFSPVEILIIACTIGWVVRRAVNRDWSWPRSQFDAPLALFILAALLSLLVTNHLRESLRVLRTVILEPALFYLMLVDTVRRRRQLEWLIVSITVAGIGVAFAGIAQWAFDAGAILAEGVSRARGFYGSPNNLGLFLGRVTPIAGCLAVFGEQRRWRWAVACGLMLVAVVLSFSWGAWMGLMAAALFLGALGGWRRLGLIAAAIIPASLALLMTAGPDRIQSHFSLEEGTTFIRLRLWEAALNMLRDHPVFGVGLDNFLYLYRDIYVFDDAIIDLELSHPHNMFLDFWLNLGVLGMVAGIWLLWRFFTAGRCAYLVAVQSSRRAIVLGLLASMVAAVVHGMVDNSFFLVDLAVVFWFACAMVHILSKADGGLVWT